MRAEQESRPFGLMAAMAVSVLLHLLFLILSWWMPLVRPAAAADLVTPVDSSVLRFTFAPVTETEQEAVLEGELPIETPPSRLPTVPNLVPPEAGVPGVEREPAPIEPPAPAPPTRAETPGAVVEEESSPELTPDERATILDRPTEQSAPRRALDLDRALRDFGDQLERARESARRSSGPRGSSSNVYVPDLSSFPTTGYGMGNLVFETRDFDWSDYARQIYIAIWRAWHNRLYQTTDEFERWAHANGWFLEHQNQIRFVIERSGQVTGIAIEGPSGCLPLDQSATEALAEVILPPLPADFPKEREVVHARFIAIGEIRHMRPVLTRLKQMGAF